LSKISLLLNCLNLPFMKLVPKRVISIALAFVIPLYGIVVQSQPASAVARGADFTITVNDLQFILDQIHIAEAHRAIEGVSPAVVPSTNVLRPGRVINDPIRATNAGNAQTTAIANTVTQVLSPLLPDGLRQVDGRNNNLTGNGFSSWMGWGYITPTTLGKSAWGAADRSFPRLVGPVFRSGYETRTGNVTDAAPRVISNLIVDQSEANPAARAAASCTLRSLNLPNPCTPSPTDNASLLIRNQAPNGVAAPYNGIFTLFGQFFSHGLDLVGKSSTESVKIPLAETDPLYETCVDLTNRGCVTEFSMGRTDLQGDVTTGGKNTTTPWIDQNQTYTSHPSHQVFLREYFCRGLETASTINSATPCTSSNPPIATGKLIDGDIAGNIANWSEVKRQAANKLGIQLVDMDIHDVPLLLTDEYGRFLRSSTGFPQVVTGNNGTVATVRVGNPANPVAAGLGIGHAFLDDIAHFADPKEGLTADSGDSINNYPGPTSYDNELLDKHFITGDGRGNENIGLTSIHTIFHAEHNRLWADIQNVINTATPQTSGLTANDLADFKSAWRMSSIRTDNPNPEWNGERLFQAAKLITEMEYQHIVFGEFVRKVQPAIKEFRTYDPTIRPDIVAEFAHTVYRFGHSQLNETVERTGADGTDMTVPLLYAFLNPTEFNQPHDYTITRSPQEIGNQLNGYNAAGSVLRGMANQTGNEIDEFVTGALRNNLLGLPLDLATLNIARGRDSGISTLNGFRSAIKGSTSATNMSPYTSWAQFGQNLRHPQSLVNFIAAYGKTSGSLTFLDGATADVEDVVTVSLNSAENSGDYRLKRAAAQSIVDCYESYRLIAGTEPCETFMLGKSGLDDIDLWVGGLAEKNIAAGSMLGNAFDYVFKKQIENLQESDRFYYLGRVGGLNLGTQIETNFLSDLIMRNTDVTSITTDAFAVPTKTVNMTSPAPSFIKVLGDGTWMYSGDAHVLWNGTSGNDKVLSDRGDDSIYGVAGNDWLRGGDGDDFIQGGEGRDVIEDTAGINNLIGGNGNDYLSGSGTDIYNGNNGDDFLIGGTFGFEAFAGFGNDWLRGGTDDDRVSGDEGDDWAEGGEGSDRVVGDIGVLGVTLTNPGRDVLIGNSGNDLLDGFNGADIFIPGYGTDLNSGGLGFDWVTYFNDGQTEGVAEDLANFAPAPGAALANLADQYQEIEGLSGGDYDDTLSGTTLTTLGGTAVDGLSAIDCSLITGLSTLLPSTVTNCVWNTGDIIIGGAGSDTITGRNGDDLIDGNAVLQTWVSIPSAWGFVNEAPNYVTVPDGRAYVDSIARVSEYIANNLIETDVIASLQIVRVIAWAPKADGENDVAVFQSPRSNYTITVNTNGTLTVRDLGNGAAAINDGRDILRNIETLRFSDGDVLVSSLPPLAPGLANAGLVVGPASIAVTWTAPALLSGTTLASYTARAWTSNNAAGTPEATCTTSDGTTLSCTITGLAPGNYFVDVIATNSANVNSVGSAVRGRVTVAAAPPASLSPNPQNRSATKDVAIDATSPFTPTGLTGTLTYTIAPSLPSGLSLDSTTGVITGTPTVTLARTVFTITATDSSTPARTATSVVNITVADFAAPTITTQTPTITATQNSPITATTGFTPANLTSPVTYALTGGTLPTGLSFNTSTGVISGTPSTTLTATTFTVTATDASARTATATISITVTAANAPQSAQAIAPTSAPTGATVTAANGSAVVTWNAVPGVTRYTAQAFSSPTSTRVIRQCSVNGTGGASTFSCSLPRLQSFSTYYVEVVARNSAGAMSSGNRISVVIP
jgi:Ca2+-binding RTX toxin-like protein